MGKPLITDQDLAGLIDLVAPEIAGAGLGSWTDSARCADGDPEIFFPPRNKPGKAARAVCAECQVRAQCLAYATVHAHENYGIWGGLSRLERIRLRDALRGRRAGRPPDAA